MALPVGLHGFGAFSTLLVCLVNAFVELLEVLEDLLLFVELVNVTLEPKKTVTELFK